jgi:hypothetical protein
MPWTEPQKVERRFPLPIVWARSKSATRFTLLVKAESWRAVPMTSCYNWRANSTCFLARGQSFFFPLTCSLAPNTSYYKIYRDVHPFNLEPCAVRSDISLFYTESRDRGVFVLLHFRVPSQSISHSLARILSSLLMPVSHNPRNWNDIQCYMLMYWTRGPNYPKYFWKRLSPFSDSRAQLKMEFAENTCWFHTIPCISHSLFNFIRQFQPNPILPSPSNPIPTTNPCLHLL